MLNKKIPYVYWLKNKTTGLKYIGVRYAKNCHPKDFWINYFTSSKSVHKLINLYGKEDFKWKILHIFDNEEDAIFKEQQYLQTATKRNDYLNFNSFYLGNSSIQSLRGKIGGAIQRDLKLGIHKQTKEERLEILKKARKIQLENNLNMFINVSPEVQSLRGKIGGKGNKGFIWINDGKKSFKYTSKDQMKLSLEEFLNQNLNYKRGRINENKKNKKNN